MPLDQSIETWGVSDLPDRPVLDAAMNQAKARLFLKPGAGFLGSLLCNHEFLWDETVVTGCCNGKTIRINPYFFVALNVEQRISLLVHEMWHTGFQHMLRAGHVIPMIWNMAADHVINLMMIQQGFDLSWNGLMQSCQDPRFVDMTTEEVYKILYDELVDEDEADTAAAAAAAGADDIGDPDKGDEKQIPIRVAAAVQAAQMAKAAGDVPGDIKQSIDKFLNPVLPWEVLLARFMTELSKDDYSWKRPSRRHEDEYLPSLMGDNGLEHLMYFMDISISVTDAMIQRFTSEVRHIHQHMMPKRLTIVTFDTQIQDVYEFQEGDPFDGLNITGRGGTSLECVREYIVEHKPTAAVVFSDMECYPMDPDPGVPILWTVVENPDVKVPFGRVIHIEDYE